MMSNINDTHMQQNNIHLEIGYNLNRIMILPDHSSITMHESKANIIDNGIISTHPHITNTYFYKRNKGRPFSYQASNAGVKACADVGRPGFVPALILNTKRFTSDTHQVISI